MKSPHHVLLAAAVLVLASCRTLDSSAGSAHSPVAEAWAPSADLQALAAGLTGHFSSAGQAERDEAFLHIELRAVRIWPERSDGIWLYVEQAAGWALEKPYRQRLYRLTEERSGVFTSAVYLLPGEEPLEFAGAWAEVTVFASLGPAEASIREGCEITLTRGSEGWFRGQTTGKRCESSLGDAVYATSSVLVSPRMILSWDRGWTGRGAQAWGAETGPYLFERQE